MILDLPRCKHGSPVLAEETRHDLDGARLFRVDVVVDLGIERERFVLNERSAAGRRPR